MSKSVIFLIVFMMLAGPAAYANNISLANIALADQDTGANTYDIEFDIAWDNSWFITGAPSLTANWDAAWVFAKFSKYSNGAWGAWSHCTLLNTGSVAAAGSQLTFAQTGAAYKGAFIYRSAAGSGSNDWDNNQIRWDYGTDGIGDSDIVRVRVFGIEMVYVPTGNFYVGDSNATTYGSLKWQDGTAGAPQITSALGNAINSVDNTYDDSQLEGAGIRIDGDGGLDTDASGSVDNASFPTGYTAFYLMKYELSQGQYRDFLNTLTRTQQNYRTATQTANYYAMSNATTVVARSGIRVPSSVPPSASITFGCDLEGITANGTTAGDGVFNESNDGEWVAANYLSWMDLVAYADWAALRPATELELVKSARGGQAAVDDEYSWGDATVETLTTSLSNSGQADEAPNQGNMHWYPNYYYGPFRVGSFADSTSTRANSGAGYYGVMELSGNLWERAVSLGNSVGRAFDGSHGDGSLSTNGYANTVNWPRIVSNGEVNDGYGAGVFFSSFAEGTALYARLADRALAAYHNNDRSIHFGGRLARTAP